MKKIGVVVFSFLIMFIVPGVVQASYSGVGSEGGGTVGTGCAGKDSCWPDANSNTKYSTNGFRVTLYKLEDNSITNVYQSYDFLNNEAQVNSLKGDKGINFVREKSGKIDYLNGESFNVTSGDSNFGSNIYYYPFNHFISGGESVNLDVINFFNSNQDSIAKLFQQHINDDINKYYFVVEPLTIAIYNYNTTPIWFYGTSYEHARYASNYGVKYSWIESVIRTLLPTSLYVDSTIGNDKTDFSSFLNVNFNSKLADLSSPSHYYVTKSEQKRIKLDYIQNYAYGMYVLHANNVLKNNISPESCDINVTYNNCGNISISEASGEVCTLARKEYYLKSYNDSGQIYCTNNVSTDFNEFYTTFNSSIRSGSYFPMDNLNITTNKTCYIKSSNGLSSVKGWQSSINETLGGNIKLTLGNKNYTLEEKITSETPVCQTWSSGICTKATMNSTHTYSLNPLVNRFINIQTMQQDVYNYQTATNIDNGGARLTIPLNYLTGIYKYNLNLNESLLSTFINSRAKNYIKENYELNGKLYKVTYNVTTNKTDSDLSYSCPYKATQDQCEDEEGSIYPCPVEDTKEPIPDDKCYIDGKVSDCPKTCESDCCDANGNEIACPGGDSVIGNVIYRPISLVEPFPGIDGTGRVPGFNWDRIVKINGQEYTASDYYIRNNRGYKDYEIYQSDPLYVIKLDGNTIREIREYNDSVKNNYNDFNLECQNGEKCISKFLRGTATNPSFSINLISSGTCKNINYDNFDSCITRKGA